MTVKARTAPILAEVPPSGQMMTPLIRASASVAITMTTAVRGIRFRSPPLDDHIASWWIRLLSIAGCIGASVQPSPPIASLPSWR